MENCDDAGESATCDEDCTFVVCNDGHVNSLAEDCEDGNVAPDDGCDSTCQSETCGDGITNNGDDEDCDDAGESLTCDANCTVADCGDGSMNDSPNVEECDDGLANDDATPDACRTNCLDAHCGDGVADSLESCDDSGETATCDDDCSPASCGDGNENNSAGEECDDGVNAGGPDACRPGCVDPVCGDLTVDPGEGEMCDSLIAANCTANCCSTGAAVSSYNSGLAGLDCQLSHLVDVCDPTECRRAKGINKKISRMFKGLDKAMIRADEERLSRSEAGVRGIRKRASSLQNTLLRRCPDDDDAGDEAAIRMCLDNQLQSVVVIALETEENLALENP